MAVWLWSSKDNRSTLVCIAVLLTSVSTASKVLAHTEPDWLDNPCNGHQMRHSRSADRDQLKLLMYNIEMSRRKELTYVYGNDTRKAKHFKGNCLRVNGFIKAIERTPDYKEATRIFYESMVQLAKYIYKLQNIPVVTPAKFRHSKRKEIFNVTEANLKLVICEYNITLRNYHSGSAKPKVPQLNSKCLPKQLNISGALVEDLDFYRKIRKFFKQSKRILNSKRPGGKKVNKKSKGKKRRTKLRGHSVHRKQAQ
ncbi:hypothetical protein JTB14_032948 [Gonioctena quinquepunctata]|nr:hypothetical protein JTB14_032948 [Gonioctena quinquepunctata]